MNTQLAGNESAVGRLRADMEKRDREAARREAGLRTEAARRDRDSQRWIIGLVPGCAATVVGAVGLL
ncbi:MAG: hypothetical protein OXD36_15300 [Rhodobacter sp.]|nr:hypothetical protein [Rhodobacter sp.]